MHEPEFLSLRRACELLPDRPHHNTARRWMHDGVRVDGKQRIKLRSVRFCGKRLTTKEWIDEFVAAVQALNPAATTEHQQAIAALDAMGVA